MKILITGVAGFIGSNLVEYLAPKGHEIVGIDNFNQYYPRKVKDHNLSQIKDLDNFTFVEADLTDDAAMRPLFMSENFDAVINIAAWAGVTQSFETPKEYFWNNTYGVASLLDLCREYDVKKFVQASTSSEYTGNEIPWDENMDRDRPQHPYAASKRAAEIIGYSYYSHWDIDFNAVVFFNVYGPRQRPDMALTRFFRSIVDDEYMFPQYQDLNRSGRDYTYVKDICAGIDALLNKKLGYQIFNLGSCSPITLGGFVETIEKVTNEKVKMERKDDRPGEARMTFCDNSKAKTILGWTPKFTFEDGIKEYYEWFKKQPEWYKKGEY